MSNTVKRIIPTILILTLSFLPFVAAETNFDVFARSAAQGLSGFLVNLSVEPALLSTILLGILLWIVIYSIVIKVFDFDTGRRWGVVGAGIVSLIIVLLTFIYVDDNFIEAIALQYSALGATILTVIPFVILVYFTTVVTRSLLIARVTWIFYVVYYFALFVFKIANSPAGTSWWSASNIPYFAAIIAGVIILVVVGWMREELFKQTLRSGEEAGMNDVKLREAGRKIERAEANSLLKPGK